MVTAVEVSCSVDVGRTCEGCHSVKSTFENFVCVCGGGLRALTGNMDDEAMRKSFDDILNAESSDGRKTDFEITKDVSQQKCMSIAMLSGTF